MQRCWNHSWLGSIARAVPIAGGVVLGVLAAIPAAMAAPGDHIRFGDVKLIPSLKTGVEYHSNVYLTDNVAKDAVGAPFWLLRPSAEVGIEGAWINLSGIAGYTLRKYIDFRPNDEFDVQQLDRFNEVDLTLNTSILPGRTIEFRLSDRFDIQNTPTDLHGVSIEDKNVNLVHTGNDLDGGMVFRPGSALDISVMGTFSFDTYHLPDFFLEKYPEVLNLPENGTFNNRFNSGPILSGVWRFLPKTSLIGMVSVNWIRWKNNLIPYWSASADPYANGGESGIGELVGKPDGLAWRTSWGIKGQITSRIVTSAEFGFGQMYYDEQSVLDYNATLPVGVDASGTDLELLGEENFGRDLTSFGEGLTLNLQVGYTPVRSQTIGIGYRKDFQDVVFSNYSVYHSAFVQYKGGFFDDRLGTLVDYNFRLDTYHGEVSRADVTHRLKGEVSWKFTTYLSASLGGGWNARYCKDSGCNDLANPNVTYTSIQYDDLWVQGAVTFTY